VAGPFVAGLGNPNWILGVITLAVSVICALLEPEKTAHDTDQGERLRKGRWHTALQDEAKD
jgi:hypothetical protein